MGQDAAKKDIKDLTLDELTKEIVGIGQRPYRGRQIFSRIYKDGITDIGELSNISKALRDRLKESYYISAITLSEHLKSRDGTEKFLFMLRDSNFIETVLIPSKERKTLCLSTQAGCKFACSFCASGRKGFVRDLTPSEILNQILFLSRRFEHNITNYVFMGMGEPLDNYENVAKAVMIMNDPEGMNIGARRITISTCGIIPGIDKLKELGLQVNLSVSLHAANDRLRDELMPVNKRYPLKELINACEKYLDKTGRLITLEYILIEHKNDSLKDADALAEIAGRLKAKVNLIAASPVSHAGLGPPSQKTVDIFMKRLTGKRITATLRESKGKDIHAACGQLAGER